MVVGIIGGTVVLVGVVLLVTPGPGILIIAAGLAILAIEFAWAKAWLSKIKESVTPAGREALLIHVRTIWVQMFRRKGPDD
ncbi:MAG: PGPGW domain-containing protein [Gammaproteobacteria bacterium]